MKLLLVAMGGAAGSVARYLVSGWVQPAGMLRFPWGTTVVNLLGCLLIGLFAEGFGGRSLLPATWRLPLLVGFIGAFTTFSTYSYEILQLLGSGQGLAALLNLLLQPAGGLVGVWVGMQLARIVGGG
jgi:fluoride exporter